MKAVQMLRRGNGNFDKKGRTGRATQADFKGNGACSMGRTLFRVLDRAMSCGIVLGSEFSSLIKAQSQP